MEEDYHSYDYDDYYCDNDAYDPYDDLYADAQFEPYFDYDHAADLYHPTEVATEGLENEADGTGLGEVDVYIEDGDGYDRHGAEFGLGESGDGGVYEDIHVGGQIALEWGSQGEEDGDDGDDYVEHELIGDEDDSSSLSRLLRDGIIALIEQLDWTMPSVKSWYFFRGQFDVSRNSKVPSSSGANNGDGEEGVERGRVDKGKEFVQSQIGAVSCPICMENWTRDGEHSVCSLPCGHLYGMSCIKRWLVQQKQGKCPQCNKLCKLEDVRRLYGSFAVVDKHLEEKVRFLEAKCASLELKDLEWEKKEAEWQQKEAGLLRQLVNK